jgi:DNA modification methylase
VSSPYKLLIGDCIEGMKTLPGRSVHTCVTSPPYFGLRDYKAEGQIGLEETPQAYIDRLVEVFREVWRVLRDDGTLWLNLGDSYAGNGAGGPNSNLSKLADKYAPRVRSRNANRDETGQVTRARKTVPLGLKSKDLIGIPWRVAFALQADGWYLRQDIIWNKPNPMPESVKDRCTKAHEYIFMLSKTSKYYFDSEAMQEPAVSTHSSGNGFAGRQGGSNHMPMSGGVGTKEEWTPGGFRNRRTVWTVSTKPFKGAHFATFPPDLIEPCIRAGAAEKCCSVCAAPFKRSMVDTGVPDSSYKGSTFTEGKTGARDGGERTQKGERTIKVSGELSPTCSCEAAGVSSTVLDPFGGSGTTAAVALKHGRNSILCELNPGYESLVQNRIVSIAGKESLSKGSRLRRTEALL